MEQEVHKKPAGPQCSRTQSAGEVAGVGPASHADLRIQQLVDATHLTFSYSPCNLSALRCSRTATCMVQLLCLAAAGTSRTQDGKSNVKSAPGGAAGRGRSRGPCRSGCRAGRRSCGSARGAPAARCRGRRPWGAPRRPAAPPARSGTRLLRTAGRTREILWRSHISWLECRSTGR